MEQLLYMLYMVSGPENSGKISLRIESLLIRLLGWNWIRMGLDFFSVARRLPANSVYGISIDVLSSFPSLWSFCLSLSVKRQEPAVPDSSIPPAVAWLFFGFSLAVVWAWTFWGLAVTQNPQNGERGPLGYYRKWLCFNYGSQAENFFKSPLYKVFKHEINILKD